MERVCSKCFQRHPVAFFNKDRSRPDGVYSQCKDCTRANCRRVFRKYNEKHRAMKAAWKEANRNLNSQINREWRQANPEKAREGTANYRKRLARATPPWADKNALRAFYEARPKGHHVDHIIPLAGKTVCGLNVPENLQYLPAEIHFKKGTKFLTSAGGCENL